MIEELMRCVEGLKREAQALRDRQSYRVALAKLDEAERHLRGGLDDATNERDRDRRQITQSLADCLGMQGGVLRREGRKNEAHRLYAKGADLERELSCDIQNSYCITNELVLRILLDPDKRRSLISEISDAAEYAWKQARGARRDEWWAWADAGVLTLLGFESDDAEVGTNSDHVLEDALDAYAQFARTVASPNDYGSSVEILEDLSKSFEFVEPDVYNLIGRCAAELRRHQRAARPLPSCFVVMPYGKREIFRKGLVPLKVDFDAIYEEAIKPGIKDAGLEPIRGDGLVGLGMIHKDMLARLRVSDYAVVDLTGGNPNVFYELGVRHGSESRVTVLVRGDTGQPPPFDVAPLQHLPYEFTEDGRAKEMQELRNGIAVRLRSARERRGRDLWSDNPLVQLLIEDTSGHDWVARQKADLFRDLVGYNQERKTELARARDTIQQRPENAIAQLRAIEARLADPKEEEPGVLIDLMLSYRSVGGFDDMLALVERFPLDLQGSVFVREQRALALNRRGKQGDSLEALSILGGLTNERESSETHALTGRIYKDLWIQYRKERPYKAKGYLRNAIDSYVRGFEADPRDAYPGINALSLLENLDSEDDRKRREELFPVVRFAAQRRLRGEPDYWDHATLMELAVLQGDSKAAMRHLEDVLGCHSERFQLETTANNLRFIRDARVLRDEDVDWLDELVTELTEPNPDP